MQAAGRRKHVSRNTMSLSLWCGCAGIMLACAARTAIAAAQYEIEGEINQRLYGGDGSVRWHANSQFEVFVRDNAWLIRTVGTETEGGRVVTREYGCTNAAEIFTLEIPPLEAATQAAVQAPGAQGPSGRVRSRSAKPYCMTIVSNAVPVGMTDGDVIGHLWLMFASGGYFKDLTTNGLTPVYSFFASVLENPGLKASCEWEFVGGASQLPKRVVYWNPGGAYRQTPTNTPAFTQYPPPYANGFTDAVYQVTGVSNRGGLALPTGFIFEEYAPGGKWRSRDELVVRRRAEAVVTAIRPECSRRSLLPAASGPTLVTDMRLLHAHPPVRAFSFMDMAGTQWVSLAQARKLSRAMEGPPQARRTVVMVVLVVLLVLPPTGVLVARLKRRASQS